MTLDPARWYPVAAATDLPYGHVYQTRLAGHPLAIWRDSAGRVNVWDDRCPHRGVRFSVGEIANDELRCQYHAWRFASGTGACTFIPAQPDQRTPAAIRAKVWPMREAARLIWTGIAPSGDPPSPAGPVLRGLPVNRGADVVAVALRTLACGEFFVQPVDAGRCVARGVLSSGSLIAADLALEQLRRELEAH